MVSPVEVTDPDVLKQLNSGTEVTDPDILSQLNGTATDSSRPQGYGDFLRQSALQGRAALQGAISAATFPQTIMSGARNLAPWVANTFFGGHYPYGGIPGLSVNPSEGASRIMTGAGVPLPKTEGEQLASAATSGLTGGLVGGGLAGGAANLIRGGLSGVTGSTAQEEARQAGLPGWAQVGIGIGASQLPMFAESLGNMVTPIISQTARNNMLGSYLRNSASDPNQAIQNLDSSAPLVPGSEQTTGAASRDLGLLRVEKGVRNIAPENFDERLSQQNTARQGLLTSLGGTSKDVNAAIAARSTLAEGLYGAAANESAPIDSEMTALLQRPAMQSAIKEAQDIAGNQGRSFGLASTNPGMPMSLSGSDLQALKQSLADAADSAFRSGNANKGTAITNTLNDLKDWTLRNVPSARSADAAFQQASAPINRMQSIQGLQQASAAASEDINTGLPLLSAPKYKNALGDLQADKFSGVGSADMAKLEALRKDLMASSAMNQLKTPGSDTFQNFMLSQRAPGFGTNAAVSWMYKHTGVMDKMNAQLADAMLNPGSAANLMKNVPRGQFSYGLGAYDLGTLFGLSGVRPSQESAVSR